MEKVYEKQTKVVLGYISVLHYFLTLGSFVGLAFFNPLNLDFKCFP